MIRQSTWRQSKYISERKEGTEMTLRPNFIDILNHSFVYVIICTDYWGDVSYKFEPIKCKFCAHCWLDTAILHSGLRLKATRHSVGSHFVKYLLPFLTVGNGWNLNRWSTFRWLHLVSKWTTCERDSCDKSAPMKNALYGSLNVWVCMCTGLRN